MKPIFNSKTVWFNLVTMVIAVSALIPAFVADLGISPNTAKIIVKVALLASAVGNIVLRIFFTKIPIESKI